jgi:hypothetical protein
MGAWEPPVAEKSPKEWNMLQGCGCLVVLVILTIILFGSNPPDRSNTQPERIRAQPTEVGMKMSTPSPTKTVGPPEETRKEIFLEMVNCETRAMAEADNISPISGHGGLEGAKENAVKAQELEATYKDEIAAKYHITRDQMRDFGIEGIQKHWPMKAPIAAPTKSLPQSTDNPMLNASVSVSGTILKIKNNDAFPWTEIEVTLNEGFFGGGYTLKFRALQQGIETQKALSDFSMSDGTRFDFAKTKVQKIFISAKTPNGDALWGGGMH